MKILLMFGMFCFSLAAHGKGTVIEGIYTSKNLQGSATGQIALAVESSQRYVFGQREAPKIELGVLYNGEFYSRLALVPSGAPSHLTNLDYQDATLKSVGRDEVYRLTGMAGLTDSFILTLPNGVQVQMEK